MAQRENFDVVLVDEGLVSADDLTHARELQAETGDSLTGVLVGERMVHEARLRPGARRPMGFEYLRGTNFDIVCMTRLSDSGAFFSVWESSSAGTSYGETDLSVAGGPVAAPATCVQGGW